MSRNSIIGWDPVLGLQLRSTPYWKDCCGHGAESYVGSASYFKSPGLDKPTTIDVYIFPCKHRESKRLDVCLRYGDDPAAYMSAGALLDVLRSSGRADASLSYRVAAEVIDRRGWLCYKKVKE